MALLLLEVRLWMIYDSTESKRRAKSGTQAMERLAEEFRRGLSSPSRPEVDALLADFVENGSFTVAWLSAWCSRVKALTRSVLQYAAAEDISDARLTHAEWETIEFLRRHMDEFLKYGAIEKTTDGLVVDERGTTVIQEFAAFLKKKALLGRN
jgi:hypothetical protein